MSATTSGAESGIVLGIVLVLLAQEFGVLSLSDTAGAVTYLVGGAVVAGAVGAVIGWLLGRRYRRRHAEAEPATAATTPRED